MDTLQSLGPLFSLSNLILIKALFQDKMQILQHYFKSITVVLNMVIKSIGAY